MATTLTPPTGDFAPSLPSTPLTTETAAPETRTPQEIVLQAGLGYIVSASLNVAVKLRLPDLMGDGLHDVEALAQKTNSNGDYLFRLLRVLEMTQIVRRIAPRAFELTAAGTILRRETPGSLASCIEWIADPLHLTLYSELRGSLESGKTTFDSVFGEPFFNWVSRPENRTEAAVFNSAMTGISEMCIPAFLEAYDFGQFTKIVDVGGGHGALLRAILRHHPWLRGSVAEMASVVNETRKAIAEDGLAGRCDAEECDFFAAVPAGGDCYLMKHIVHDWTDEPALRLLRNIRSVIPPQGKLILAEAVIDDSAAPHPGKLLDIEMLAFVGGKERTEQEYRALLAAAGFSLQRVVETRSPLWLLEAKPFQGGESGVVALTRPS